ncbi:MAG: hypothetical protein K2I69_01425 [Muribaculaceae bacterium]|nr:hypothetical protein [Muribaculaceae bacterium]
MKKHYLMGLSLLLLGGTMANAQVRADGEPRQLLKTPMGLMAPVWSPDGSMIAATSDNYAGIYVAKADGTDLRMLSSDSGAGYNMTWSSDSRSIIGRVNIASAKGTVHEMRSYDLASGNYKAIGERRRTAAQPASLQAKGIFATMTQNPAGAAAAIPALAQFAGKTIINPALSPDGNSIAFQIPGKGMWLINADGTNLRSLGKGSHPAWMPDNATILYTIVEDNGSNFTASTLMSMNIANGASSEVIKRADFLPLTPSVAPDGSKVAFENGADAAIYVVNLKK